MARAEPRNEKNCERITKPTPQSSLPPRTAPSQIGKGFKHHQLSSLLSFAPNHPHLNEPTFNRSDRRCPPPLFTDLEPPHEECIRKDVHREGRCAGGGDPGDDVVLDRKEVVEAFNGEGLESWEVG